MSRDKNSSKHTPDEARLELQDVIVGYNGHTALDSISLEVPQGAQVAVVGPNGAGKSTLFKAIVGLLPLRGGSIKIHNLPIGHHRHCVGYIPQREEVDWHFPVTVFDVVAMGRFGHTGWMRNLGQRDKQLIQRAMEQMGIAHLGKRAISDLSGGQQQRVFLARTLVQEPHILLMDEPFTGVDAPTQDATLALIDQLKQDGITVLVATHDLNLAASRFERVLLMNRSVIAYGPPAQVFQPENIRSAFASHALFMDGVLVIDECCPGDEHMGHTH
jgi:ABC-type Mn2+/Zn2+ transport system ATPase subunit